MKKIFVMAALIVAGMTTTVQAQIKIGGRSINVKKATSAAAKTAKAATLSDADIAAECSKAVKWMDEHNKVDKSAKYDGRLKRLTKGITDVNGIPLNFKVYDVIDINAFACGDGSVRVFSSLMDLMTDDELMGVIGHEIGHVANGDVKHAWKTAYMASAARDVAGATGGVAATLSDSQLGDLAESFTNAQFSQKQESAADDYGFDFCVKHGFDAYGMSNSMTKLADLSKGAKASKAQKMFSSHPDSEKRAAKMKAKADKYKAGK